MNSTNLSYSVVDNVSKFLSPSKPINSEEFLQGRFKELEKIDEILSFGGRSAFIIGDRGVGKTSLAQTAAIIHSHAKYDFVYTACDPKPFGTFGKITKDLLIRLAQLTSIHAKDSVETKSSMALVLSSNPSVRFTREWSKKAAQEIPEPEGAADVIRYLKGFGEILKRPLCVILDELENIDAEECKANLAHLIKQIGDQEIPFKFIFSGIAGTPAKLIGIHESTSRYYGAISLEPLKAQHIIDIIQKAAKHFKIEIPEAQLFRIYTISCGFPHYPHLIGSKLLINLLKNEKSYSDTKAFKKALKDAVEDSHPYLIEKYNDATMRKNEIVKHILWSIASHRDIDQNTSYIFDRYTQLKIKYPNIISQISKNQLSAYLSRLTKDDYSCILTRSVEGKPYYKFSDPLMRGFIRLKAATENIDLGNDEL